MRSADPVKFHNGDVETKDETKDETNVGAKDDTEVKLTRAQRLGKLIQLVRQHPEYTMEELAGGLGVSRASVYRLIKSTGGRVKYEGDKYHGEWTVVDD